MQWVCHSGLHVRPSNKFIGTMSHCGDNHQRQTKWGTVGSWDFQNTVGTITSSCGETTKLISSTIRGCGNEQTSDITKEVGNWDFQVMLGLPASDILKKNIRRYIDICEELFLGMSFWDLPDWSHLKLFIHFLEVTAPTSYYYPFTLSTTRHCGTSYTRTSWRAVHIVASAVYTVIELSHVLYLISSVSTVDPVNITDSLISACLLV